MFMRLLGYRALYLRGWEMWLEPCSDDMVGLWFWKEVGGSWRLNLWRVVLFGDSPNDHGSSLNLPLSALRVLRAPRSASRLFAILAQVRDRQAAT